MRKDVKFGLTVGGILLATIVVYVIVLSSGGSTPADHSSDSGTVADKNVTSVMPPADSKPQSVTTALTGASPAASGSTPSGAIAGSGVQRPANPPRTEITPVKETPSSSDLLAMRGSSAKTDTAGPGQTAPAFGGNVPSPSPEPRSTGSGPNSGPPLISDSAGPSTQPSETAQGSQGSDWNTLLTTGGLSLSAGATPEHTETPSITRGRTPRVDPAAGGSAPATDSVSSSDQHPVMIDALPTTQPDTTSVITNTARNSPRSRDTIAAAPRTGSSAGGTANTAEATGSAPAATSNGQRIHVIASGENLWTIAAAAYGDAKYYSRILAANPNIDPKHLKIGKTLVIPVLTEAQKPQSSAGADLPTAPEPKIDPATQYTVSPGDSLEKIARHLYGKPELKDAIYEANKTLIGPNENVLKVGWVLKLPQPPAKQ